MRRWCLAVMAGLACGCGEATPEAVVEDAAAADVVGVPIVDASTDAPVVPSTKLGAELEGSGVRFRVWAPNATAASVSGDFAVTKMSADADGVFDAFVADAHVGSRYQFTFETPAGTLTRTDPYCRQLLADGCRVVDPRAYAWKTSTFTRPSRASSIVYELHLGSFAVDPGAPNGTFATAQKKLPELADLGVNVVELMPVHQFGSDASRWGYNPQLWHTPKPGLGTPDELRAFVDEAHRLGIAVWIDLVVNHTDGNKSAPLYCYDGCTDSSAGTYFFPPGTYAKTPWGPRPDYTKPRVAELILSSVEQWLTEYRGDGFRWDSVSNIRAIDGAGTTPGGRELLVASNEKTHALGGLSVAEDLKGYDALTTPEFGFDAQWDGFGYVINEVLDPASDDGRDVGRIVSALNGGFTRVLFTENHDTVGNGGARMPSKIDPTNPESFAARRRSMLGAVLLLTAPGVPMLFMGQELLATGTFASNPTPLAAPTPAGGKIRAFYRDLLRLRRNLDGGTGGLLDPNVEVFHRNDVDKVVAYRRHGPSGEDVLVIVNMRNRAYTQYDIGVSSAGPWRIRLNTERKAYGDDFLDGQSGSVTATAGSKDGKPFVLPLKLGAWSAMVLTR